MLHECSPDEFSLLMRCGVARSQNRPRPIAVHTPAHQGEHNFPPPHVCRMLARGVVHVRRFASSPLRPKAISCVSRLGRLGAWRQSRVSASMVVLPCGGFGKRHVRPNVAGSQVQTCRIATAARRMATRSGAGVRSFGIRGSRLRCPNPETSVGGSVCSGAVAMRCWGFSTCLNL